MQASGIDLALLRFALQHTTDSPTLPDTQVRPQDYEWLREAMASFETDAQKIKKLLELVKKEDVIEDQKCAALEELQLLVEDLDNASGFLLFLLTLHHSHLPLISLTLTRTRAHTRAHALSTHPHPCTTRVAMRHIRIGEERGGLRGPEVCSP